MGLPTQPPDLVPAATDAAGQPEPEHGRRTLLIVDDDPSVRKLARLHLEKAGFSVVTAANGTEGVVVFRDQQSNLTAVLLDLSMPGLGGVEVFEELCRIQPAVRVLLMSGYPKEEVAQKFPGPAPAGYLSKPFTEATLLEAVRQLLGA